MAEIIRNEPIASDIWRMVVSGAPLGRAGQFHMLRVPGALDPLLGRPISICEIDAASGETTFVYQTIGRGTAQFARLLPGQQIEAQGAYGNGFRSTRAMPSIHRRRHRNRAHAPACKGTPRKRPEPPDRRVSRLSRRILSRGSICTVCRQRDAKHRRLRGQRRGFFSKRNLLRLRSCAHAPRAAAAAADAANASLFVSLEKHMACGVGACLGCTCQTKSGQKRVCKDGPVFDYREVRDAI